MQDPASWAGWHKEPDWANKQTKQGLGLSLFLEKATGPAPFVSRWDFGDFLPFDRRFCEHSQAGVESPFFPLERCIY